jgi:DNA-binding transcriptional regulator PaaX
MPKQIQVSDETHSMLFSFISDYLKKHGKKLTMSDAIRISLEHYNECEKVNGQQ